MSTLVRIHAVCPKYGDKCQTYSYYSSWNTFSGLDLSRVKNICSKCGAEINSINDALTIKEDPKVKEKAKKAMCISPESKEFLENAI